MIISIFPESLNGGNKLFLIKYNALVMLKCLFGGSGEAITKLSLVKFNRKPYLYDKQSIVLNNSNNNKEQLFFFIHNNKQDYCL